MINYPVSFYPDETPPKPEAPKKDPISVEQAKKLFVRYLHHTFRLESLLDAFSGYNMPVQALQDPEVQALVDDWINVFSEPGPCLGYSEEEKQQLVQLLKDYFKKS